MSNYKSLQHTKWECKYHVVFIPKYRKKLIYEELRRHLGQVLRRLAGQKESLIEEGNFSESRRNFVGQHFWARGYFVSTVGRDEKVIREYIRRQEAEDRRQDQLRLL